MDLYLFGLGVLLMFIEFTVAGLGIFALGSLLSFLGSLYFFLGATQTAAYIVSAVLVVGISAFFVLIKVFPNSRLWKNLTLHMSSTSDKGYVSNTTHESLLGREGEAHTTLRPAGTARFDDMYRDVVTEGGFIEKGTPIRVVAVEGGRIVVRKVEME